MKKSEILKALALTKSDNFVNAGVSEVSELKTYDAIRALVAAVSRFQ